MLLFIVGLVGLSHWEAFSVSLPDESRKTPVRKESDKKTEKTLSASSIVKELSLIYNNKKYVSPKDLYSLEMRLAEFTLNKTKNWKKVSTNMEPPSKEDITQAVYLYKKGLIRVKSREEKSKLLFRIGFLYEALSAYSGAYRAYQKVLKISRNKKHIRKAQHLSYQMRKKLKSRYFLVKSEVEFINPVDKALSKALHYLKTNYKEKAVYYFGRACQIDLEKRNCSSFECIHSSDSIKGFIYTAHSKTSGSDLIDIYKTYLSYFPRDPVMVLSAAEWAAKMGSYQQALVFYERHILFERRFVHLNVKDKKKQDEKYQGLEHLFHLYHSLAQISNDPSFEVRAYDFYLKHSFLKKSVFEVRYLKNKALFSMGEYWTSAPVFHEIALSSHPNQKIKKEAALFALKALIKMNRKTTARKWKDEFSSVFPGHKDFQASLSQLI